MSSMEKSKETVEVFFAPDDRAPQRVTPNLAGYYYYFAVTAANARTAQHGDVYSDTRTTRPGPESGRPRLGNATTYHARPYLAGDQRLGRGECAEKN